jgi:uncharacterized protein
MNDSIIKVYIEWPAFHQTIYEMEIEYRKKNYDCKAIYGPPRGGLMFGVMLSHRLGLPLIVDENKLDPNESYLIVDDIVDTGETLERFNTDKNILFVMHYVDKSTVTPDYYVFNKQDYNSWIVYPWERADSETIQDYLKGTV